MSPIDDHFPRLDDERIDRLVDGELPEAERREVLLALDQVPGGWRRCALAFLEAQSWRDQMRAIGREEALARPAARATSGRRFPLGSWPTLLAMAASFLVALGLGLVLREAWRGGSTRGPGPEQIADMPQTPEKPSPAAEHPEVASGPTAPAQPWTVVSLPLGSSDDGAGSIRIPAIERERLDDGWLEGFQPPALPAELLEALRQSGHQVRQYRQLLRVPMKDDRQLVVPVDQFEFRYVGNSAYQ